MSDAAAALAVARIVVGPAINELVQRAADAHGCKEHCSRLSEILSKPVLHRLAETLLAVAASVPADNIAGKAAWDVLSEFTELWEEAEYLVGACRDTLDRMNVDSDLGGKVKAVCFKLETHLEVHTLSMGQWNTQIQLHQQMLTTTTSAAIYVPHNAEDGRCDQQGSQPMPTLQYTPPASKSKIVQHQNDLIPAIVTMLKPSAGTSQKRYVGIIGMAGIGKTTIASGVYKQLENKFHEAFFIPVGQKPNYTKLLQGVWEIVEPKMQPPFDAEVLLKELTTKLKDETVLLVLDDVWNATDIPHLNFATAYRKCDNDSCLVVTARNRQVLGDDDPELKVVEVPLLSDAASRQLFCWHAFGATDVPGDKVADYGEAVSSVLSECKRLPLALQVLGSSLKYRAVDQWLEVIKKLQGSNNLDASQELMHQCRISYDSLPPLLQQCFLDFAAYPENARINKRELVTLWAATTTPFPLSAEWAEQQILQLLDRCLIVRDAHVHPSISLLCDDVYEMGANYIMHSILRDLAVSISRDHPKQHALLQEVGQGLVQLPRIATKWQGAATHVSDAACEAEAQIRQTHQDATRVSFNSNDLQGKVQLPGMPKARVLLLQSNSGVTEILNLSGCHMLRLLSLRSSTHLTRLSGFDGMLMLRVLDLSGCWALQSLSSSIGDLPQLQRLDLSGCRTLQSLPDSIGNLQQLQSLHLRWCNSLQSLPDSIGKLTQLPCLDLSECHALQCLPDSIGNLLQLQRLELCECHVLQSLPDSIGNLPQLQRLGLVLCHALQSLPESIGNLLQLQELDPSGCRALRSLPDSIGDLPKLQCLDLGGCHALLLLPDSIGNLSQLQFLNLSDCRVLQSLPDSIGNLPQLQMVDLGGCSTLQPLPDSIGNLTQLQRLYLYKCHALQSLPGSIGNLLQLQFLNLSECSVLHSLPDFITKMTHCTVFHHISQ